LHREANLSIVLGITEAQHRRFKGEIDDLGPRVDAVVGVTEQSPRWRHDPEAYAASDLDGWEDEWRREPRLVEADFVVSDNLVGVLASRPDAVLSGSFLWSDVLEVHGSTSDPCRRYVARERALLDQIHPWMLASADLATNGVRTRTRMVPLPWMVDAAVPSVSAKRDIVLVHGGGTRTLDTTVRRIARTLRAGDLEVATDLEDDERCFGFTDDEWRRVGLVICRPGVGTATECVRWQIPMMVIRDPQNTEAEHIYQRLILLGFARECPADIDVREMQVMMRAQESATFRALRSVRRGGIARTAVWIHELLLERSE
jgi:hypothetical protein